MSEDGISGCDCRNLASTSHDDATDSEVMPLDTLMGAVNSAGQGNESNELVLDGSISFWKNDA